MVCIVQNLKGGRGTVSPKMGVWLTQVPQNPAFWGIFWGRKGP
ncbi:hypothetical protein HKBW3S43_01347, partial [Candidatus Hakubella thermalkaliphila]